VLRYEKRGTVVAENAMRYPLAIAATLITCAASPGRAADLAAPTPVAPVSHGHATQAIECPLHKKGVNVDALRPFADSEKYIEFLERPDRAAWQKPNAVLAALHLAGSETLVDEGAGSGYFTFRFAKALPKGKVVAVDVDPQMVRHIHHKVMSEGIANVRVVLTDPNEPAVDSAADIVFVCDVIHHVEGREAWLRKIFAEMKAGAKLVVIEFKEGKLPEGPPESVKIPKAKLTAMLRGVGFLLKSDDPRVLPYQTFLVFEKPSSGSRSTSAR
jgi:ubiquinone/menaquinone biosynthesis C-methylase UbiE